MHLIVLENHVTTLRGGQELNLLEICTALSQRGHRITLLYLKDGDLLERYQSICDRVIKISEYGFDWRRFTSVLVFCNDYHFSVFGSLLSRCRNLPLVCYLQLPPLYLNRQRRFGVRQVDRFIAVSHHTKQDWIDFGVSPDRIEVVHNGIDIHKFKPASDFQAVRQQWGIAPTTQLISYIGRIDREKGLETLIHAIARLSSQFDVKAFIAGKPLNHHANHQESEAVGQQYQRSLEQLAAELGIRDRIEFVGHLADPVTLYQASDVNVLPSVWNEPCSRGLFESLACGVPKIASRIGGSPEILSHEFESMLFTPGDVEDLTRCLTQIMHWRTTNPTLEKRCRQHIINHFSNEKMMNEIEQILLHTQPPAPSPQRFSSPDSSISLNSMQ